MFPTARRLLHRVKVQSLCWSVRESGWRIPHARHRLIIKVRCFNVPGSKESIGKWHMVGEAYLLNTLFEIVSQTNSDHALLISFSHKHVPIKIELIWIGYSKISTDFILVIWPRRFCSIKYCLATKVMRKPCPRTRILQNVGGFSITYTSSSPSSFTIIVMCAESIFVSFARQYFHFPSKQHLFLKENLWPSLGYHLQ